MPETTFQVVLVEGTADERVPNIDNGAPLYGFKAWHGPGEDARVLLEHYPPATYVIYEGTMKFNSKGMTLPANLKRVGRFEVPWVEPVKAEVKKV